MKRNRRIGFLASVVLSGLLGQAAHAQVVIESYTNGVLVAPKAGCPNSTSQYRTVNGFTAAGFTYSVEVNPLHPTNQNDPTANYLAILNAQRTNPAGTARTDLTFGDVWDFPTVSGGGPDYSLSNGSIKVRRYTAEAAAGRFGVDFWADYVPSAVPRGGITDPSGASMHWIQIIKDNWNISAPNLANRGPGKPENIVDVTTEDPNTVPATPPQGDPYYDNGGCADSSFFFDGPRRLQAQVTGAPYNWNAELFVVKEVLQPTFNAADGKVVTKGKIQIYDGVNYGFVAQTPEPGAVAYLIMFSAGAMFCLRLRRTRAPRPSR